MARISIAAMCLLAIFWGSTAAAAQQPSRPETMAEGSTSTKVTIEQALEEAVQNNLGLMAERMNLTIAEASLRELNRKDGFMITAYFATQISRQLI